ncbi:winged helix-turn-helix transcriptional regulator [Novosphingobium olei]|uniref:Helix-turn-helix transcriptional regulator n=1 Tax=Novosphingobium olei TaxID=2728851 RepID=A0A7Y0BLU8_9SPHN|nr:helix-turn-helix domain-containing protein [Novosphingobium olei]NML92206.1 helix-turn-helix transcriptional regulator [Novosphingobium olei]
MKGAIDLSGIDPAFHQQVDLLARDMSAHGVRRDEPVRTTFAMLGDRWSTLILLVLGFGTWRHAELRRVLGRLGAEEKISQRVLTLKLRAMERDGYVVRHVVPTVPPRVSYALTDLGAELRDHATGLIGWVNAHQQEIRKARVRFDLAEADAD